MNVSSFQYDLFRVLSPVLIGLLSLLLIVSSTPERRRRPEARVYILFLIACIGFIAMNFMEMISKSEEATLLWSKFIYVFIGFIPLIWIDFCVRFTHEGRGLGKKIIAAIMTIPLTTLLILFIPGLQSLMWNRIDYFTQGTFIISRRGHGPWFTVYAVYTYACIVWGAAIVIRQFPRQRSYYRRQSFVILAALIIPIAASLIYILKLVPGLIKDYTPFGYAVSAIIFYIALFRMDVFALVPVGRAAVMERLGVGVLVLDREYRLADANPAAMRILGIEEKHIGKLVGGSKNGNYSLPRAILEAVASCSTNELILDSPEGPRFYRVEASLLDGSGCLAVLSEETELRRLLSKVEELARTDELTGLPNRRAFMEQARREIARALRHGISLAAAMIDLDGFKAVNDTLGHGSGDAILKGFGAIISQEARTDDVYGRLGGDEFAILAAGGPGATGIRFLCDRLRRRLESADFRDESGAPLRVTISTGIAALDRSAPSLEKLLANADSALYAAKGGGRNAIVVYGE